jgi:hypothetical protein
MRAARHMDCALGLMTMIRGALKLGTIIVSTYLARHISIRQQNLNHCRGAKR